MSPGWCGLVGVLSCALKGHRLDYWSGHIPRLWIQSPVPGQGMYGRQLMDVPHSHRCFCLFLSLPFSLKSIKKTFSPED